MLNEKKQTQMITYCIITFTQNSKKGKTESRPLVDRVSNKGDCLKRDRKEFLGSENILNYDCGGGYMTIHLLKFIYMYIESL